MTQSLNPKKKKSDDILLRKILGKGIWSPDWGKRRVESNEVCRKNSGKNV